MKAALANAVFWLFVFFAIASVLATFLAWVAGWAWLAHRLTGSGLAAVFVGAIVFVATGLATVVASEDF